MPSLINCAKLYYFRDENIIEINDFLNRIKHIADSKNISIGQLVLLWTLEQPGITITLVGARNAEQAIQNAKATDVSLSTDEVKVINAELDHLKVAK